MLIEDFANGERCTVATDLDLTPGQNVSASVLPAQSPMAPWTGAAPVPPRLPPVGYPLSELIAVTQCG